jgi:hypothetical protein
MVEPNRVLVRRKVRPIATNPCKPAGRGTGRVTGDHVAMSCQLSGRRNAALTVSYGGPTSLASENTRNRAGSVKLGYRTNEYAA